MSVHILASAAMPWRTLRLGPLRFTPFGLAAAAGLVGSMAFVRRCAVRAAMDPDLAWDVGLFAIFSCFAVSRLLLALGNPSAFRHYPMLLLGLPSLTFGGMALAAAMAWIYLRRKGLPVRSTLDVFAAPAALLAAFLELGHWLDGSEAGMPTHLPWGVAVAGASGDLRVHPVALYGIVLSLALTLWLWRALPVERAALREPGGVLPLPGRAASLGLFTGGLIAFVLDMFSAPPASTLTPWLEPGQWIALAAMLAGTCLWASLHTGAASKAALIETPLPVASPLHMEVH